jgi:hypothetical protein
LKEITNIQYLRALAVLSVVTHHVTGASQSYDLPAEALSILVPLGQSGVDLFFVISGFIMVYIQKEKIRSPQSFFLSRVIRILPLYWLLTFLLVLLRYIAPSFFRFSSAPTHGDFIASLVFLTEAIFAPKAVLFLGWTLEYEMLFYALFSISLFASTLQKSILFSTAVILAVLIIYPSLMPSSMMMIEFLGGMLIGSIYLRSASILRSAPAILMGGLILLSLTLFFDFFEFNPEYTHGLPRVLKWGIPSMLIVFGSVFSKQGNNRLLSKIGDASYSIYLIQAFTIPCYYKFVSILGVGVIPNDVLAIGCLLFTAIVGVITYTMLEKPTHLFLNRKLAGKLQ